MKLSKKKETELYNTVHNKIMDARVKILMLVKDKNLNDEIDDVMYKLINETPLQAINLFKPKS